MQEFRGGADGRRAQRGSGGAHGPACLVTRQRRVLGKGTEFYARVQERYKISCGRTEHSPRGDVPASTLQT